MKILLINKFHYIQGGADRHYLELADILRQHGHEIIYFSMHSPQNQPCEQDSYFLKYLDFSKVKLDKEVIRKVGRMMWSREASAKLEALILKEKPDIAHLHNIYHQISPSIIKTLKQYGVPTVMTVHDYYLVSPIYSLFAKNKIFDPVRWQYWKIILHRAVKNSFGASLLSSFVSWWHRYKGFYKQIDLFISPSHFLTTRLRSVYKDASIAVLPNFVQTPTINVSAKAEYYLYAGRIINEKGVELILQAAQKLPNKIFYIAGSGPDQNHLKQLYKLDNVKWLGKLNKDKLYKTMSRAKAVIVPSRWYENCPLTILESLSLGIPVIASKIGGIPEIIKHEYNGLLFDCERADDLIAQIIKFDDNILYKELIAGAKESAKRYDTDKYYKQLMSFYESL